MSKRRLSPTQTAIIGSLFAFIGTAIGAGIIGNRADSLFVWITTNITTTIWIQIIAIILLLGFIATIISWRYDRTKLKRTLEELSRKLRLSNQQLEESKRKRDELDIELQRVQVENRKLEAERDQSQFNLDISKQNGAIQMLQANVTSATLNIQDSLLKQLPGFIHTSNLDNKIHDTIKQLLSIANECISPSIRRGLLLLPDENKEYLSIWDWHGWFNENSKNQIKFYIGPSKPSWQRGIAGDAYFNLKILVAHVDTEKDKWHSNIDSYVPFEEVGSLPSHHSLICIPAITKQDSKDCLGIICFDSKIKETFDDPQTKEMLQFISRKVTDVLLVYQECKKAKQQV